MIPIASLDAAIIIAETVEMPLHSLGVLILEPSRARAAADFETARRLVASRLPRVPAFRRRIVQDPFALGDLYWLDDPAFDLDRHFVRERLPAPGGSAELASLVGTHASRPLDRGKPLWEIAWVDGLATGEIALVAKVHHAAMDGMHLMALLDVLCDRSPDATEAKAEDAWRPEPVPSPARLVAGAVRTLARKPIRTVRSIAAIGSALGRSRGKKTKAEHERASLTEVLGEVPSTPWNGALSTHRSVAFADVRLADLRTIRASFGTTINDVVLAASTASLRRWLLARDALPSRPLIANVPVATKGSGDGGNQFFLSRVHLPIGEANPVARLRQIHDETQRLKKSPHRSGANLFPHVVDLALQLTVPRLLASAVSLYARHGFADFLPAPWNLVISNVLGPGHELYFAGAKVTRIYPCGPVQHGSGLNLTVLSTTEHVCLGALACSERVPDLASITSGFVEEIDVLRRSAES